MAPTHADNPKSAYGQAVADPVAHFKAIPWCAKLLTDASVVHIQIPDRHPRASREFALVNETLNTTDAVRACVVMVRKLPLTDAGHAAGETTEKPFLELLGLLDLGKGVNGYEGTAHGGFFNVVLDEVMGSTVHVYSDRLAPTAFLNVRYKKPLFTPQVVMVRGRIMKAEGRKLFVGGSVENEKGEMFAEADGLWVMKDARPEKEKI